MCAHVPNYNDRDTRDRWRHGKSESAPSLTKVFRRRTSHLNFFAKITSAPMSFHFCADGVAVLGTVWIPAAQSKRRSSAGACVDGFFGPSERIFARPTLTSAVKKNPKRLLRVRSGSSPTPKTIGIVALPSPRPGLRRIGHDYSRDLRSTKWRCGLSLRSSNYETSCPLWVKSRHWRWCD